ncbi:unnamed protein product [Adineta steineri]|uniref:Methyltransferase FkbM domain-containing protein n=1 Tax=Adineta steineri TaxID=433720 RepID=A0A814IMF9_9BILA|nr:unnamed protein product [Adineta steineri]CAF1515696.1 unnamed protein product [Adineta steineri]
MLQCTQRKITTLLFIFSSITILGIIFNKHENIKESISNISPNNFLDGCRYIYIDMGTNIGVQIRKLYEPDLYPSAPILPIFEDMFENNFNEVCSIGFEANPLHDKYLTEFERYCLARKWRVKIFKSTAVSYVDKKLNLYIDPDNENNYQKDASLVAINKTKIITVQGIDIASWFRTTVLNRKLSPGDQPSRIMMKSDIEGHDSTVLANLIFNGVFCSIDLIYGEHFNSDLQQAILSLKKYSNTCKTEVLELTDEKYDLQKFPFVIPESTD